ncbi:MAG: CvpA family protein [Chloroflexi bacterium]|nr:CvpA family protein [Chloroflexota bacterium]
MNWLDIVIVVGALVALLFGLRMGLIRAAALVVGVIVGLMLARVYSAALGEILTDYVPTAWANWLGFAAILVGVIIGANIVGRVLRKIVSLVFLGWADTLAGGVLGLALAALLLGTVISLAAAYPFFNLDEAVADSRLAPVVLKAAPVVLGLLPDQFQKVRALVGM